MPFTDPNKLAEIMDIATEQQSQPGFASMAGKMQRRKEVTYNARTDVISHGTFFDPADFDPFTYPHMSLDEINVVRDRNFHIVKALLLNYDEDIALNENVNYMVLAQIDYIDIDSDALRASVNRVAGKKARRQALTDLYAKAVNNVLMLHREGYECIKHGPLQYEIRKKVFEHH